MRAPRRRLAVLLLAGSAGLLAVVACGGDHAPATVDAGCTLEECARADGGVGGSDAAVIRDASAAPDATGPIPYPDPLAGTTKAATLVKNGFQFTEGPVWIGGRLLFTDIPAATIWQLEASGQTTVFRANSGGANGLAVDPQGRLLAAEHGNHRVSRSDATIGATPAPLAERFPQSNGKRLNSPNDVIVRKDGNVYFTDPDYGGPIAGDSQLPVKGVYRLDPQGNLTRIADDMNKPNGIALSPDGATLYVDDTEGAYVRAYPVGADGNVGAPTKLTDTAKAGCDGIAIDDAGNLYVTTQSGVEVFDPAGKPLGVVTVPKNPTNATFGGPDRRVLYVTAQDGLYSITLNVPGLP